MGSQLSSRFALILSVLVGSVSSARATTIGIPALPVGEESRGQGWRSEAVTQSNSDRTLRTGWTLQPNLAAVSRGFLTFDLTLPPVFRTRPISAASLEFSFVQYDSPDAAESLAIVDVSTPSEALNRVGGDAATFADLGGGRTYALLEVRKTTADRSLTVDLSGSAVLDINAQLGKTFSVGLALTSLRRVPIANERLFGSPATARLNLTLAQVPEPSAGLLALGSVVLTCCRGRGRRKTLAS